MLVLGRNNDDKGAQLEALTRALLQALGYTNVVPNYVAAGGEEVDVRAEYVVPGLVGATRVGVLCECKAYRSPLDMSHWLKFLGKVLTEDLRAGTPTRAYLIALAGVNGNVTGSYDDVRRRRTGIEIVSGDRLLEVVRNVFRLYGPEDVTAAVAAVTTRPLRSFEVVYYDGAVYWVATLAGDVVALLDREAVPIGGELLAELRSLIADALPVTEIIDLREEAEAQRRTLLAEKLILSRLLSAGGRTGLADPPAEHNLTPTDVAAAVEALSSRNWIATNDDGGHELLLLSGEAGEAPYVRLHAVDRFLLDGPVPEFVLEALWSEYRVSRADEGYLAHLVAQQGGIELTPDELSEVRRITLWSPSALAWLLTPDSMLSAPEVKAELTGDPSAEDQAVAEPNRAVVARFRHNHLFRALYDRLARDSRVALLRPQLHDVFDVLEVQTRTQIAIKGRSGVLLSRELDDRTGLGRLADGLVGPDGSPYVLMQMMPDAPEPWARFTQQTASAGSENTPEEALAARRGGDNPERVNE